MSDAETIPRAPSESLVARLFRLGSSFGAMHTVHTVVNIAFTLIQLLVLARVLDKTSYQEVVFLTAVGMYIQPVDQALGRANYVTLRPQGLGATEPGGSEAFWSLISHGLVLIVASFLIPLGLTHGTMAEYFASALFLFGCFFTNYWSYSLQSTVWSVDMGASFAFISVVRRFLFFVSLGLLWVTQSFLLFNVVVSILILAFCVICLKMFLATPGGAEIAKNFGPVGRKGAKAYVQRFWTSLLASLSELVILNSPYAVFSALFGIGPAVVAFDTIMKVGRLGMAGTRALSEILLPQISRGLMTGEGKAARRNLAIICSVCVGVTLIPAGVILLFSDKVFTLLLGHNNILPSSIAPAAATIILITGLYQPATFFLGYLSAGAATRRLTLFAVAGLCVYSGLIYKMGMDLEGALWSYAIYFAGTSLLATMFCLMMGANEIKGERAAS